MTQQEKHLEISRAIDQHLGTDSFCTVSLTAGNKYQDWYAMLLSSIALLAANEQVLFAYSDIESSTTEFRIIVFTTNLVLVANVHPQLDGIPLISAIRRKSLIGMQLSTSERIDARERRSHEWPGTINLVLTYSDLPDRIEIAAGGADPYNIKEPSPIVKLIEGLSSDLANGRLTV